MSSYDISLEKQEVLVKGTIGYDDLHAKIAKTGKQVRFECGCVGWLVLMGWLDHLGRDCRMNEVDSTVDMCFGRICTEVVWPKADVVLQLGYSDGYGILSGRARETDGMDECAL